MWQAWGGMMTEGEFSKRIGEHMRAEMERPLYQVAEPKNDVPERFRQMMERTPIARLTSGEPKEGYYWDVLWQLYFEGNELFRARIKKLASAQVIGI